MSIGQFSCEWKGWLVKDASYEVRESQACTLHPKGILFVIPFFTLLLSLRSFENDVEVTGSSVSLWGQEEWCSIGCHDTGWNCWALEAWRRRKMNSTLPAIQGKAKWKFKLSTSLAKNIFSDVAVADHKKRVNLFAYRNEANRVEEHCCRCWGANFMKK